jgi:hypothetical protein
MKLDPSSPIPRRRFLRNSTVAAAALISEFPALAQTTEQILGAEDSNAPQLSLDKNAPSLRVLLHEADGQPLPHDRQITLHARDLENDPLPQAIASAEGRVRIGLTTEPFQVSVRLKVPGFGEVYSYADNNGKGYVRPQTIEFVIEAAETRLRRVRAGREGYPL